MILINIKILLLNCHYPAITVCFRCIMPAAVASYIPHSADALMGFRGYLPAAGAWFSPCPDFDVKLTFSNIYCRFFIISMLE